jgi:hypothetical protein
MLKMEDDSIRFYQEWQQQFEQELLELEADILRDKKESEAKSE